MPTAQNTHSHKTGFMIRRNSSGLSTARLACAISPCATNNASPSTKSFCFLSRLLTVTRQALLERMPSKPAPSMINPTGTYSATGTDSAGGSIHIGNVMTIKTNAKRATQTVAAPRCTEGLSNPFLSASSTPLRRSGPSISGASRGNEHISARIPARPAHAPVQIERSGIAGQSSGSTRVGIGVVSIFIQYPRIRPVFLSPVPSVQ